MSAMVLASFDDLGEPVTLWSGLAAIAWHNRYTVTAAIVLLIVWHALGKRARLDAHNAQVHAAAVADNARQLAAMDAELPHSVARHQIHGQPGRGLSKARFGDNAEAGRKGEEATVEALRPLLAPVPGRTLGQRGALAGNPLNNVVDRYLLRDLRRLVVA